MKRLLSSALLMLGLVSCQQSEQSDIKLIDKSAFEATVDGKDVSLYTLTNDNGMTMQVTNFGARVVSIWVADRENHFEDVVYGYETLDRYMNNTGERFLGATIGRYGNRIADGKFSLNGEDYQLSTWNNGQCLHGGDKGFDMVVWDVVNASESQIDFAYVSPDMEEGFPGTLDVKMSYILTDDNEFKITYSATTDKATPVNLTNHPFFNLKGEGNGDINGHIMQINASAYTPVNASLIPTGEIADVEGTPFDFRTPTAVGSRLDQENEQFTNCMGYDHNFVLDRKSESDLELAATIYEPTTGRQIEVLTTEPGLQFYGGNFFDGSYAGKSGKPYEFRGSMALETQHFPDSPNQPQFPSTILEPGETYSHVCIYKFSAK